MSILDANIIGEQLEITDNKRLVSDMLDPWRPEMGRDYKAYKNHVNRVIRFCFLLRDWDYQDQQKIIIAACFHDLGIWSSRTFDYLEPSIALAKDYLHQNGQEAWIPEISLMIEMHHKITRYTGDSALVEIFRRADLVDVSLGMIRFGLAKTQVKEIRHQFPNAGFHKRLTQLIGKRFMGHPLRPLPMFKW